MLRSGPEFQLRASLQPSGRNISIWKLVHEPRIYYDWCKEDVIHYYSNGFIFNVFFNNLHPFQIILPCLKSSSLFELIATVDIFHIFRKMVSFLLKWLQHFSKASLISRLLFEQLHFQEACLCLNWLCLRMFSFFKWFHSFWKLNPFSNISFSILNIF